MDRANGLHNNVQKTEYLPGNQAYIDSDTVMPTEIYKCSQMLWTKLETPTSMLTPPPGFELVPDLGTYS